MLVSNKGFTLLESLIVLMIVSIITTLVITYGYQTHRKILEKQQIYQLILDIQKVESYSLLEAAHIELITNSNKYYLIYQKQNQMIREEKILNEDAIFQLEKNKKLYFNQGQIHQPYTINIKINNRVHHVVIQMEYGRVVYNET